ncbi:MAG: LPS export ABC transporter ATP-binding protein [Acidobacteriota bacterium]
MSPEVKRNLQAQGLTKQYGSRVVLRDLCLQIDSGEVVGLLGPNGAGKTTTFHCVLGLIRPDRGRIVLNGEDITSQPMYRRARKGISYLPQEPSIFRRLTVGQNLIAVLETLDLPREELLARAHTLLKEFRIEHLASHPGYSLSGGERRRTEIARALVLSPCFILLDEPFTGLDPKARSDVQRLIAQLRERGIGVLITDHNVRETLQITDRAYIIAQGIILKAGTPQELAADQEVREVYLGEDFRLS